MKKHKRFPTLGDWLHPIESPLPNKEQIYFKNRTELNDKIKKIVAEGKDHL